jgi:exonuclease III
LRHPIITHIYKVATLNINGISSRTLLSILEEFLWKQDIDLALVQEVKTPLLSAIRRYTAYMNEGTDRRRTAILVRDGIPITDIKRIPSDKGMAAILNGTWIVNIYAPSGAEKKK